MAKALQNLPTELKIAFIPAVKHIQNNWLSATIEKIKVEVVGIFSADDKRHIMWD